MTYHPRHARRLCLHHLSVLAAWSRHWRHESAEDFDERRAAYVRQCCGRRER